jgi:aspartyl aminopeptidase
MAFFKNAYYGGIKKYHWVPFLWNCTRNRKADGTTIDVSIGADEAIRSLRLPTAAASRRGPMKKNMSEAIRRGLNIVIGSRPEKERKARQGQDTILKLLNEKYGITEEDFLSAELMAVPAFPVRDIGLDRSMIGGYGQDDRVCAYCELAAILDIENPVKTAVCLLVDKEEIGSEGVTGMKSQFFERFIADLCKAEGTSVYDCFARSFCLSADVCNAFDPNFPEVIGKAQQRKTQLRPGHSQVYRLERKSGASDASARLLQRSEECSRGSGYMADGRTRKVDQGGGGTVAMYTSQRNIDTIDAGVSRIVDARAV